MNKILTIGNVNYDYYEPLNSVKTDINKINEIFKNLDYEVTSYQDIEYKKTIEVINNFCNKISDDDNIILYYSGHGFHRDGHNFILVKDSKKITSNFIQANFYEDFYNIFDIKHFLDLANKNTNCNIFIIIDACRTNIPLSTNLQEPLESTNAAWQLYATSLGSYSFANGIFTKAIEKVIYRKNQTVSGLYESICIYMKKKCPPREYQKPILISGTNEFCITSNNTIIEENYFRELINVYIQLQIEIQKYGYPYTYQKIKNIVHSINPSLYMPMNKLADLVKKMIQHHSEQLGILELLIDENINSIHIFSDRFFLHGQLSNYHFSNPKDGLKLYDFNSSVSHINSNSKEVDEFRRTYGKTTYLNYSIVSTEESFTLILNNVNDSISSYIDDHYSNDSLKIAQLHTYIQQIFREKKSFLISGGRYANKHTFISCLLTDHIYHYQKICELVHLTPIKFDSSQIQRFDLEEILRIESKCDDLKSSIKMNTFDWLIIPLSAYHEATLNQKELACLLKIEQFAQENKTSLIFYTDFLKNAISTIHITKQALPFSEYQIDLDRISTNDDHIYITEIEKISK